MTLQNFFHENPAAALAFSGGTDSAYLLYAALECGADVTAYYVRSPFQPAFELADARRLADALGADMRVLELDTLAIPQVRENGPARCYHCKKAIFSAIAAAHGPGLVLDGTNASDREDDRPGFRALRELGVRSPLRECGLTKAEVRRRSREAGLFTWDKPAYACLATRVPVGEALTREALARTEAAEAALAGLGFRNFRVRTRSGAALLQLREADLPLLSEKRARVLAALAPHYTGVMLDLEVRKDE